MSRQSGMAVILAQQQQEVSGVANPGVYVLNDVKTVTLSRCCLRSSIHPSRHTVLKLLEKLREIQRQEERPGKDLEKRKHTLDLL